IGYFLLDLVKASVHVAASASAPWIQPRGRILIVPLRSDYDLFGVLTAELTTLVPGSIVIDLDTSRREMVVHIFDASAGDDATFRARVLQQEARVLRALARRAEEILAVDPDSSDTGADADAGVGT
ncbi:MAG: Na+/H+ antiporter subunit E, partial [Micrococcales bacterium]|nr:Na+/H+ antiporter subunit E [Micrococcales bacterium]